MGYFDSGVISHKLWCEFHEILLQRTSGKSLIDLIAFVETMIVRILRAHNVHNGLHMIG